MKLKSLTVLILVLGVSGLVEMVNGICLITNRPSPKVYSYNCYNSINYVEDLESAPVDIPEIMFSKAKIRVLQDRSFRRFSNSLEMLEIYYTEIGEIQDRAFEGLSKLQTFVIEGSNLRTVQSSWFRGLTSLRNVSFKRNDIRCIESSFFSIIPKLNMLDVSQNQLDCLPVIPLATSKTQILQFKFNPLTWGCVNTLMYWLDERGIEYDDFGRGIVDPSSELVLDCETKLGKPHHQINPEELKRCAEKTVRYYLPRRENNTIEEICSIVEQKPSRFLTCF